MRPYLVRPQHPLRSTWERRFPAIIRGDNGFHWVIRGDDRGSELASGGPMSRRAAKETLAEIIRWESDDRLLEGVVVEYQIPTDQDTQCHRLHVVREGKPQRLSVYHEILSGQFGRQYRLVRKCRSAFSALATIERRLNRDLVAGERDAGLLDPADLTSSSPKGTGLP